MSVIVGVAFAATLRGSGADAVWWVWFALVACSAVYVAYDAVTRNPELTVMKWGWLLVTLYIGPVGAALYVLSCQEPARGAHEQFTASLWKQSLGSTIHCVAGDATGIVVAASVTTAVGLPMWGDTIIEYAAGFGFGLLVFQALFMRDMLGGRYLTAVRATFLAEWVSMNCVMAGMVPVMVIIRSRIAGTTHVGSVRFWVVLSLAVFIGLAMAYPVNVWLVHNHLKHGMGTVRALGHGVTPASATTSSATMARPEPIAHAGHPAGADSPATTTIVASSDPPTMAMDMAADQAVTRAQLVAVVMLDARHARQRRLARRRLRQLLDISA